MNFVIVNPYFYPKKDPESYCSTRFASALAAVGHSVEVVTAWRPAEMYEGSYPQLVHPKLKVTRVGPCERQPTRWPHIDWKWLTVMEDDHDLIAPYVAATREALARYEKPVLVTRTYPWLSLYVGWNCRKYAAKWIQHFSDPMINFRPYCRLAYLRKWSLKFWMRRAMRKADAISVTCKRVRWYYREQLGPCVDRAKFILTTHIGDFKLEKLKCEVEVEQRDGGVVTSSSLSSSSRVDGGVVESSSLSSSSRVDGGVVTSSSLSSSSRVDGGVETPPTNVNLDLQPQPIKEVEKWRRERAEEKIAKWLDGVDDATFGDALKRLVDEKRAASEYAFKSDEECRDAIVWAKRFFAEFSRKLIELSDGRYVYFVPDIRSRDRNVGNARAWAEYAFHAVSTGGKPVPGKAYFIRHYSTVKCENLSRVESTIKDERCVAVIERDRPERDAIHFVGVSTQGKRFDIVTRLDEHGNVDANLSEVTVVLTKKRYLEKDPPPVFRPLTEAVEAVAKHQAAGFSPSTTVDNVAHSDDARKGTGGVVESSSLSSSSRVDGGVVTPPTTVQLQLPTSTKENDPTAVQLQLSTSTNIPHLIYHDGDIYGGRGLLMVEAVDRLNAEGFPCLFLQGRDVKGDADRAKLLASPNCQIVGKDAPPELKALAQSAQVSFVADFDTPGLAYSPFLMSKFVYQLFTDRPIVVLSKLESEKHDYCAAYLEAGLFFAEIGKVDSLVAAIKAAFACDPRTIDRTRIREAFSEETIGRKFVEAVGAL